MPAVGIGGVFFRANDPEALQAWYRKHLGVGGEEATPWAQQAGPTVFMPFPRDTNYFPAAKSWMLNFRVANLDGLVAALRHAGIAATTDPEWETPETGRFARIHDPEGNPLELWEPPLAPSPWPHQRDPAPRRRSVRKEIGRRQKRSLRVGLMWRERSQTI